MEKRESITEKATERITDEAVSFELGYRLHPGRISDPLPNNWRNHGSYSIG